MANVAGSKTGAEDRGGAARIVLLIAAGLVASILGLSLSLLVFGDGGETRRGGPFSLVDQSGRPVDESILKGAVSLVYFGFTHCPDVCPTHLVNAVAARDVIREKGRDVQIVFVSVDPERDTPSELAGFVEAFGEDVVGLTGSADQVAAAAKAYGVTFGKSPPADPNDPTSYEVVHTTYLYAIGPDAYEMWRFPGETPPEVIDKRLVELGAFN